MHLSFMKKSLVAAALSVVVLVVGSASLAAEDKTIVIRPARSAETTTPNRSVSVPIEAYCDSFAASMYVVFDQAFGNVTVCIENLSTGEYVEEVINAGVVFSVIALLGSSGLYHVSFVLPSGTEYFGEFEL